ncbi:MAG: hypothetical protein LC796_14960 [Acidobacteria bacterium]|nr:hypothetical protein [Acidobacteriota bacterium]MCA1609504.1 hypothetical protein [Acidobacteriota bacterium]
MAGIPFFLILILVGCHDRETSTAPGALANVRVDAPESARSGETFVIDVSAVAIGINNVRNGHVQVTLPAPLLVLGVEPSAGTSATFSNGTGATVSWDLNTLDSNSQSRLHIRASGVLPAGSAAQSLTVRASMTADGVRSGDAVAEDTIQLLP